MDFDDRPFQSVFLTLFAYVFECFYIGVADDHFFQQHEHTLLSIHERPRIKQLPIIVLIWRDFGSDGWHSVVGEQR
jgi:hypothetical protein